MTALFVTSTGTDIGKTFVAAGLIRALRRRGRTIDALKPVVSGFARETAPESDPGILLAALGRAVTDDALDRISPWRFAAPLSPDMAARREGRAIDVDEVVHFSRRAVDARTDILLIEGVGGIMVPLDDRRTVLDWMSELALPLLLVVGSYLGSISHTLTALDVLRRRDLSIAALIVSESVGSTVPLDETVATIARFAPAIQTIGLPRLTDKDGDAAFDRLADLL